MPGEEGNIPEDGVPEKLGGGGPDEGVPKPGP